MYTRAPSITRRRAFCPKRRPYNTHRNLDLAPVLAQHDNGVSFRALAHASNIRLGTLHRHYTKWVRQGRPSPFQLIEQRGRKTKLTPGQEIELVSSITQQIDDQRVIQYPHVRRMATELYARDVRQLRSPG
jgi:hypothetical protein